jgi:FMN phosphatase YigB (HAD superfamily)
VRGEVRFSADEIFFIDDNAANVEAATALGCDAAT